MSEGGSPPRCGIAVLSYNAAATIDEVLDRVPLTVLGEPPHVRVADDASRDDTAERARAWASRHPERRVEVVRNDTNLGYGGNQKGCFRWFLDADLDVVVFVHGDAQYPPERVPDLVQAIVESRAGAAFGSRMLSRGGARAGGMPLTRYLGNKVLSSAQNALTGARLSEWHSGFRAYTAATLRAVDFESLPDGFDADTVLTMLLLEERIDIVEIPIPTHYGDELSDIHPFRLGVKMLGHALRFARDKRHQRPTMAP